MRFNLNYNVIYIYNNYIKTYIDMLHTGDTNILVMLTYYLFRKERLWRKVII